MKFSYTKPIFNFTDKEAVYFDLQRCIEITMVRCATNMKQHFFNDLLPNSMKSPLLVPETSFTENLVMFKVLSILRAYLHFKYKVVIEKVKGSMIKDTEKEEVINSEISKFLNQFLNLSIEVNGNIVEIKGIKDEVFLNYIKKLGNVKGFKVISQKEVKVV